MSNKKTKTMAAAVAQIKRKSAPARQASVSQPRESFEPRLSVVETKVEHSVASKADLAEMHREIDKKINDSEARTNKQISDLRLEMEQRFNESDRKIDAVSNDVKELKNTVDTMQNTIDTMRNDMKKEVSRMMFNATKNAAITASIIATGISAILMLFV